MSALFNQTNLAPQTSQFITRTEVIQGLSTLFNDLSGINVSSFVFGTSPNPSFSTITMNSNGLISGYAALQAKNLFFTSTNTAGFAQSLQLGALPPTLQSAITSVDINNSNAPLQGNPIVSRGGLFNGGGVAHALLPQGALFQSGSGTANVQYLSWNGLIGASQNIALNNISTINGIPPNNSATSYTNLTGNNITNNQVITTPSMVGLSSLNALPISAYQNSNSQPWVPYTVTNTASSSVINLAPGLGFTPLTFNNIPIPTTIGREVTISVPISFQITTPPSGVCNLYIQAFIGGSLTGGTSVDANVTITPATTNGRVTLCGVATTNGSQPALNIQVSAFNGSFSATFVQGAGTIPRQFYFQTLGF